MPPNGRQVKHHGHRHVRHPLPEFGLDSGSAGWGYGELLAAGTAIGKWRVYHCGDSDEHEAALGEALKPSTGS
jgi:hypothetical protein